MGNLNSDPHACTGSHLSCLCSCPHPSSVASARHFICHLGIDTTVCGWQVQKNSLVDGSNLLMTCLICRYQQNKQRQISWPSCVCSDYVRAFVIDAISFLSRIMKQLNISASLKRTFKCVRPFWMQKALQWRFAIHLVYEGPCQIFFFFWVFIKSHGFCKIWRLVLLRDFCWELPRIAILSLGTAQALNINCLLGFSPTVPCTLILIGASLEYLPSPTLAAVLNSPVFVPVCLCSSLWCFESSRVRLISIHTLTGIFFVAPYLTQPGIPLPRAWPPPYPTPILDFKEIWSKRHSLLLSWLCFCYRYCSGENHFICHLWPVQLADENVLELRVEGLLSGF